MKLHASVLAAALAAGARAQTVKVHVDTSKPRHTVAHPFLGTNLDTGSIYNGFDLTEPKLAALLGQMGPTVLRIGGTAADYSWYLPNDPRSGDGNAHTIINNTVWDNVIALAQAANIQLMWDFDSLQYRDKDGHFDPTQNATAQLEYLDSKYGGTIDIIWSTGNEPDLWPGTKYNGSMLGTDAVTLAKTVLNYRLGSTVYGPSYAGFNSESAHFMAAVKDTPNVKGFTCHNYPLGGHEACDLGHYLVGYPEKMAKMAEGMAGIAAAKAASGNTDILLVLEETGGSYGGGCENITDRYVSGFWYLNAMGLLAYNGMDRLHRQDIAGWSFTGGMSHYQLAGPAGWVSGSAALMPHPDWFTTVLHKQLVDRVILPATLAAPEAAANVSAFAWCGTAGAQGLGGLTVVYTNPTANDVTLDFSAGGIPAAPRVEFLLTSSSSAHSEFAARLAARAGSGARDLSGPSGLAAPPASIQDDAIFLNGSPLTVDPDTALLETYPIPGKPVTDPSKPVVVPAYSYGFVVLTGGAAGSAAGCM